MSSALRARAQGGAGVEGLSELDAAAELVPCTLRELLGYFLRLGTLGFGGPIALVGYMQRDLVETRRWISQQDYSEGLALAQLAPGPLAAQLAIYLGWVRAGVLGATLVAVAFVLPSFLMVLALSALYLALRRAAVDAGRLLRHRRGRDRDHRAQRLQARAHDARQGSRCSGRSSP